MNQDYNLPAASKPPFFIVGAPRSGTTLLQTLLDGYSACSIPPESHVFDHFGDIFACYGDLNRDENLQKLVSDLLADERILRWELGTTPRAFCDGITVRTIRGVLSRLFELYAFGQGKSRWGDKTPEHTLHLEQILSVFPEARVIHLVRDGRDVAESLARAFFGPPTLDRCAVLWKTYVNAFDSFQKNHPGICLTVHYEDLVKNPGEVLDKVLSFIGEPSVTVGAQVPETRLKSIYRATDDGSHQSLDNEVSGNKVGLYREAFSRRQLEIFECVAGSELKRWGYALETDGSKGMSPFEKLASFLVFQMRFLRKIKHPDYVRDRIQFHMRRCRMKKSGSGA